jgi:transcriptional regulator with XRE-family HTH domain
MAQTQRGKQMLTRMGERLRSLRITTGYEEAAEFARSLGIERMRYNYYELGKRMPPLEVLDDIQKSTNADLNWLLLGRKPRQSND